MPKKVMSVAAIGVAIETILGEQGPNGLAEMRDRRGIGGLNRRKTAKNNQGRACKSPVHVIYTLNPMLLCVCEVVKNSQKLYHFFTDLQFWK